MTEPIRFREIDDASREIHSHLTVDDRCLYLVERTSGKNYSFSKANQLIANLKKKPSTSSARELRYKAIAINTCARDFRTALNDAWINMATLVPIPSSKVAGHPDYDDRMLQICKQIKPGSDVRELVSQQNSMTASHEVGQGNRHTVQDLLAVYSINEAIANPEPVTIGIVDDVLTAGTHYRAMHTILSQRFPGVPIVGIFISRRVFANDVDF